MLGSVAPAAAFSISVRSAAGDANAIAGASIFFGSISNSLVRGTRVQASAPHDTASVSGGGLFDAPIPNGPPGGPLTLIDSTITDNVLASDGPPTLQGAGLYIQGQPLTLANSVIARNHPDHCDGC